MSQVHTQYGPGRIIDQETVRGRTRYKVAGEGFEVWVDQTKLGGMSDEYAGDGDYPLGPGYDRPGFGQEDMADYEDHLHQHDYHTDPDDLHALEHRLSPGMDDDDPARYSHRQAWAPLDRDNSTELPYNPDPQHDAIGSFADDESSTIQPIHHIDAEERLRSSDSLTFEEDDDYEDDGPGPSAELFAREAAIAVQAGIPAWLVQQQIQKKFPKTYDKVMNTVEKDVGDATGSPGMGKAVIRGGQGALDAGRVLAPIAAGGYALNRAVDYASTGPGWGNLIKGSSRHEANPAALALPLLRTLGPMALQGLMGGGEAEGDGPIESSDPGPWGGLVKEQNLRPAGLDDRYIDLTASVDYWNDPAAQFRHDPDAYINRIGHLMDEGLDPRFAEYMELVEGDRGIRTAAWKDVRKKAMRLKREGHVTVKDMSPSSIMASVVGDHGTYDVTILKGASIGGITGNSIANWHCACEWGRWAFRRKYTYVGRLCSHAYASYLTMQSSSMKGQRPTRRGPSDAIIVNRPARDRYLPTFTYAAGLHQADALQNGPDRLTPEMVVNDTDDAHMFMDVTKDERDDVGPDDVMSDKDIMHFSRVMAECERTEQPYPRQLVAFLSRYADCNDGTDDTQADYEAPDSDDANEYLDVLRDDADRKQEEDFGSMADRVHKIQDAVEEARSHGTDASRFVAMMRRIAAPGDENEYETSQDGNRTVYRQPGTDQGYIQEDGRFSPADFTGRGTQGPEGGRYNIGDGPSYTQSTEDGRDLYRTDFNGEPRGQAVDVNNRGDVRDVEYVGDGKFGENGQQRFDMGSGGAYSDENFQDFLKNNPGVGGQANPPMQQQQQQAPGAPPVGAPGSPTVGAPGSPTVGAPATAPGGAGGAAAPAPMTSGTIADGGVAGAENGVNTAITKNMLDADGNYTVGKGDTWSDIAQRTTGDMNNYQKMYDTQKGGAGGNIDSLAEGTKINLKDFANDIGNNGVKGDVTNPASGGPDGNKGTQDFEVGMTSPSGNTVSTAQGFAGGGTPAVETGTAAGDTTVGTPPTGAAPTNAIPDPAPVAAEAPAPPAPAAPPKTVAALRTARDWLRWAAEGDSSASASPSATDQAAGSETAPDAGAATSPGAAPATNPAISPETGTPSAGDVYDPNNPVEVQNQNNSMANPGMSSVMPSMSGTNMNDVGGMVGQGVGVASDIASGIGGAMGGGGLASGIGGLASGIGSAISGIFSSRRDVEDWRRYAYPAGGGDDFDPETLPHIPFAGSGSPGPLEFGTSEEYADKARKEMDDVTDLGDNPLSTPMGEWQKQGSYDESNDDDSDIVRSFQANMGNTALGAGGGGGGRFDDFSSAAQGFLRTAGRNFSLAEQDELVREGDKGGARNLASLDLKGTHYEEMDSLGW